MAVEYLLRTALGERADAMLVDADVAAPALIDAEVLAVLRREVMKGRLVEERADEAVEDLRDWGMERVPHRDLLAGAWALRGHVTAYDALYVELARTRGVPLLTADGPLARASGLGIAVHNVRNA